MSRTPVFVLAAAILSGVLWVQELLEYVVSLGFIAQSAQNDAVNVFLAALPRIAAQNALEVVLFGAGWLLSTRFWFPVRIDDSWRRTLGRGAIATAFGVLALVVGLTIIGFLGSIGPGDHPFGFAFDLHVTSTAFSSWAYGTAQFTFQPLFEWFPLSMLVGVLLKLWMTSHPDRTDATDLASAAA